MNFHVKVTRRVIEQLTRCRVLVRVGIGYDDIDIEAATEHGIPVANVPDYCVDEVSDHALSLLLACARKLFPYHKALHAGQWDYMSGAPIHRLRGQTLGLVALGKIARSLAGKAKALGLRVIAYDPYLHEDIFTAFGVERRDDLEALLSESDFVSLHTPLTPETQRMFGEACFQAMKPTAFLINTSRGPVIQEPALIQALQSGRIAGAAIDVFQTESLEPDHPLLGFENVIVTPHVAWYSEESLVAVQQGAIDDVLRVLQGKRPRHLVNPGVYAYKQ